MERNGLVGMSIVSAALSLTMIITIALVLGQGNDDLHPGGCVPGTTGVAMVSDQGATGTAGFTISPSEPYHEGSGIEANSFQVTDAMLRNVAVVAKVAGDIWPSDQARRDRAILIGTITGIVETNLRNDASPAVPESLSLPHDGVSADHDSIGFFQQRALQGYHGTARQIMDVSWAAYLFFGHPRPDVPADHDWGLDDYQRVKGRDWLSADPGEVAADIQRPAEQYRYRYGVWVRDAAKVIQAAAGIRVDTATGVSGAPCMGVGATSPMDCPPPNLPEVEKGLTPDGLRVVACAHAQFPQVRDMGGVGDRPSNVDDDHQTGRAVDLMVYKDRALGDQIARWAQANAAGLGVKYIIWYEQIWSTQRASEGWRPYANPNGADDTAAHRDHVHISVQGNAGTGASDPGAAAEGGGQLGKVTLPIAPGKYSVGAPFGAVGSWSRYHTGQDLVAPIGTPVMAAAGGRVEPSDAGSWAGTHVIIRHGDGSATLYAHMSGAMVQPGATVQAGQVIGAVGLTGRTFGPHLHFEHYPAGAPTTTPYVADDPMVWLRKQGVQP